MRVFKLVEREVNPKCREVQVEGSSTSRLRSSFRMRSTGSTLTAPRSWSGWKIANSSTRPESRWS